LRIYTELPQSSAGLIKQGMTVQIFFPELPGQAFAATVLSTSDAIREASRTSTVELLMENKDGKLFSGSYAEVHFDLPSDTQVFRLPVSALLFRKDGLEVAVVGADNRVVLKRIAIVRDLGRVVEVASGLDSTDRVIDSPSDSIVQGDVVRIKPSEAAALAPSALPATPLPEQKTVAPKTGSAP
jgi:hypothetical protein